MRALYSVPDESKVAKIRDWPACRNVTEVRGFLGTCGLVRVFVKNYAQIARPLVNLTKKNVIFEFTEEHQDAMDRLKQAVINSQALRPIY